MLKPIRFPFDKSGRSPNNFVQDEPHVLLSGRERRIIVPNYIPFYVSSLIITDNATGQSLDSSDYYCADFRETIQREVGKEVASTIVITRKSVSDNVTISYQVVGGDQSLSSAAVLREQLNTLANDSRPVVFDAIVGKPSKFSPSAHPHDIGDIYGFEYLVYAIDRLRDAIANGDADKFLNIYQYIDQQDDNLLKLILKNKADIAENVIAIGNVQDNLDDLRLKIYGTTDKSATKVIKSFMPPSPRRGNILSWDNENGGYYVGVDNPHGKHEIYVDKVGGEDVGLDVDPERGFSPLKPFKSLDFALSQHHKTNGHLTFYCHGNQEHEIPNTGTPRWMAAYQNILFNSYILYGSLAVKGENLANVSGLDSLNDFIKNRAATIVIGDSRDENDKDGFGYRPGNRLFHQYNYLYESHIGFFNVKVQVRNWNINNIYTEIESSGLDSEIKDKAKKRKNKYYIPLFGISRLTFKNSHIVSTIQNREGQNHLSMIGPECYVLADGTVRFSGKLWNLKYSPEHKSGFHVSDPNKVFVDDGTRCTIPTPINRSITYLLDYLDCGDHHYHFANIQTNIRPKYPLADQLDYSDAYLNGNVDCLPYKINVILTGKPSDPGVPSPPPVDNTIGIPYFDERGRLFVKGKEDGRFYQLYPAIWHGDSMHPGVESITGAKRGTIVYRSRDYGGFKGIRDEFIAYTENRDRAVQIWPPVWQELSGSLPSSEIESNLAPPVSKRGYLYYNSGQKRWYVSTIDKTNQGVVYPARWEKDRNKTLTLSKNITPQPGGTYSLGKAGVEFGGETKYRGFRRTVEVLYNGQLLKIEKSKVMQWKMCMTRFTNVIGENEKPFPTLSPAGEVTWDYGDHETFDNYSAITTAIGPIELRASPFNEHSVLRYLPSSKDTVYYGDRFLFPSLFGYPGGQTAVIMEPYLYCRFESDIKEITGQESFNLDKYYREYEKERLGLGSFFWIDKEDIRRTNMRVDPKLFGYKGCGVLVVTDIPYKPVWNNPRIDGHLTDGVSGIRLGKTKYPAYDYSNPIIHDYLSTTDWKPRNDSNNFWLMTEFNGNIYLYRILRGTASNSNSYALFSNEGWVAAIADIIPNTRVEDLPEFGSNFKKVLIDPVERRINNNRYLGSLGLITNAFYRIPETLVNTFGGNDIHSIFGQMFQPKQSNGLHQVNQYHKEQNIYLLYDLEVDLNTLPLNKPMRMIVRVRSSECKYVVIEARVVEHQDRRIIDVQDIWGYGLYERTSGKIRDTSSFATHYPDLVKQYQDNEHLFVGNMLYNIPVLNLGKYIPTS